MRTITITKKIYSFSELTEEIQKVALEKYADINIDSMWHVTLEGRIKEEFKIKHGITCDNLYFNLDGSNLNCYLDNPYIIDKELFLQSLGCDLHDKDVRELLDGENGLELTIETRYYSGMRGVNEIDPLFLDKTHLQNEFDSILKKTLDRFKELYEYLTSEEAIRETLMLDIYEFDEEGNIFQETHTI